jgi:lipoprotein signal peptidase
VLIEGLLLSLIIGKIRGGKLKCLGQVSLRNPWMFILAFAIEFGTLFAVSAGFEVVREYGMYLHTLSYVVLFIAMISNSKHPAMWILFFGALLNFIVIFINGGAMPISIEGLIKAGLEKEAEMIAAGGIITHQPITDATRLVYLADVIILPPPYPFPKLMSIGDFIICLGVIMFVQKAMLQEKVARQNRMIRFKYKSKI